MTVASLWKALDRAGCGKPVGSEEMLDHHGNKKTTNPWNYNERSKPPSPTLAIDLSIWICESLSSSAMAENHADPTLHLVFSRTLKLLNIGIKLVGVIEGKRRLRQEGEVDEFQKRRGGTRFWRACERCEKMLQLLGVPVVRAKAEGEALCALLNQEGIVDGVISNDGDCFLFGAKVLYTKFSIENLNQGSVMRYDADNLVACVDDDDSDEFDIKAQENPAPIDIVSLSRSDLIVFAILTGSDVAGGGLSNVGCRKALRFVRKCQMDNPLKTETAAFDEIVSWARARKVNCGSLQACDGEAKCSLCCHRGTKAKHLKYGCTFCGTSPGEPCFQVSPGGKFRQSLRAKALAMEPKFDPESIAIVYQNPNDKQIPSIFVGMQSHDVFMRTPDLQSFLQSSLIIRGRSCSESRSYVLQSLSHLLAKSEMSHLYKSGKSMEYSPCNHIRISNQNKPLPVKIVKAVTRSSTSCFQLIWKINATTTDSEGNPMDEFEFSTIEDQSIVKKCFPELVEKFVAYEKERAKQGNAEQERRKAFIDIMVNNGQRESDEVLPRRNYRAGKGRREFFPKRNSVWCNSVSHANQGQIQRQKPISALCTNMGDDAAMLFQVSVPHLPSICAEDDLESIETVSTLSEENFHGAKRVGSDRTLNASPRALKENSPYKQSLTPSHLHFLGSIDQSTAPEDSLRVYGGQNKCLSDDSEALIRHCQLNELHTPISEALQLGLFDKSPCLKRSKFSRRSESTSHTYRFPRDRDQGKLDFKLRTDDDREAQILWHSESASQHFAQASEGNIVLEENLGKHLRHANLLPQATHENGGREQQGRLSTGINVEMAGTIERLLLSSDVDEKWLVESFCEVSIHSLHSPKPKGAKTNNLSLPLERRKIGDDVDPIPSQKKRLGPSVICHNSALRIKEIPEDDFIRNDPNAIGDEIIKAAYAKWEYKSRLARFEKENRIFLQDEFWRSRFD